MLDLIESRLAFCRQVMKVQHTVQPSDKLETQLASTPKLERLLAELSLVYGEL